MQSISSRRLCPVLRTKTRTFACKGLLSRSLSRSRGDDDFLLSPAPLLEGFSWSLANRCGDCSSHPDGLQRLSKVRHSGDNVSSLLWAISAGSALTALSLGHNEVRCDSSERVELGDVESFQEGTMTEVSIGPGAKRSVLVAKHQGNIYVTGAECPHCSHPQIGEKLAQGTLCSEGGAPSVKCRWAKCASFDLQTGKALRGPRLDSLSTYQIDISDGKLSISTQPERSTVSAAITPSMARRDPQDNRVFAIVGGGAAAMAAAETLRQEGFTGRVVMLTQESVPPYDRVVLSKNFNLKAKELFLRPPEVLADWDIEVINGVRVRKVDAKSQIIDYQVVGSREEATTIKYDKVLVATGGSATKLFVPGGKLPGIFTCRTPEDVDNLSQVAHKGYHVVVVGGSFMGMELASTLKARGCKVTMIAKETVPFEHVLGKKIGAAYARLLQTQDVEWIGNSHVRLFRGEENIGVGAVELDDGEILQADAVVLGIGVVPNTAIVQGVSLDKTGGILCGPLLNSRDAPTLYAAGDVCSFPSVRTGQSQRIEHWDVAVQQGRTAARNMLNQFVPFTTVPFFWSLAFGNTMRFVGQAPENFDRVYVEGNLSQMEFIAYVAEDDDVRAVVTLNKDQIAAASAELMRHGAMPTVSEILVKEVKIADDLMQRARSLRAASA